MRTSASAFALLAGVFACGPSLTEPPKAAAERESAPCAAGADAGALDCRRAAVPLARRDVVGVLDPDERSPLAPPMGDAGARRTAAPPPTAAAAPPPLPRVAPLPVTIPLAAEGETGDLADALRRGDAAFEKDDLKGATRAYEDARGLAPKGVAAKVGLLRVKIAATKVPFDYGAGKNVPAVLAAARELAKLVLAEPESGPAHAELGRALLLEGDAAKAAQALKRAAELLPKVPEVQSSLAIALLATGHVDEALPRFRLAKNLDVGSGVRHGHLGTALLLRGEVKEAISEYELAARLADTDARAHSDLGTALLADNQAERAARELERAVLLDPSRATFRSNLGYALQSMGKRADAIVRYREAIKLDPKLASAWINLATALAQEPQTRAEARGALERARAIDPTDPRVIANLKELSDLERGVK